MTLLTPVALQNLYHELVKHPAMVAQLTDYQKDKLRHYAEDEALKATRTVVDMMDGTLNYPYPEEYRNGREVEYLLSKHSPAYWDSQQVLRLLNAPPARPLDTPAPVASSDQPQAKGPLSDILRYFPTVAATLGNAPTDESALTDLAVWLSHWHVRSGKFPEAPQYSLPGQIEEQQRAAPDTGKFLKACIRLHEALTPRLAAEQPAKKLLGPFFNAERWQAVREAVTWWAGWIKKQGHSPVRQYLDALKTISVFQNAHHQWDLNAWVCDDSISRKLAPIQREFKHAYRELPATQQQGYLHELRIIADFDTERIKRYREDYEQNRYALEFLVSDVDEFLFPVWDRMQTVSNQVSPLFWSWLRACIAIRQGEARALLVALGESLTNPAPTAAPAATSVPDRLTVDELALLCVYTYQRITSENAKEYLEGKLTSGRALYNRFTYYTKLSNRIGFADETAQVRKNMIARIQKVLPRLTEEQKKRAENEIVILNGQNE